MSFASILSEPATKSHPHSQSPIAVKVAQKPPSPGEASSAKAEKIEVSDEAHHKSSVTSNAAFYETAQPLVRGPPSAKGHTPMLEPRRSLTALENERVNRAMAGIEDTALSDLESPEFDLGRHHCSQKAKKRALQCEEIENTKRKVWSDHDPSTYTTFR